MGNIIVWADIPVLDIGRAKEFYGHVLQTPVDYMPGSDDTIAMINPRPGEEGMAVSADLALNTSITPSTTHGTTIYLDSGGDIDGMLARVTEAGGTVLSDKAFMGPMVGWIAWFRDTEGNRIGIQQPGESTDAS